MILIESFELAQGPIHPIRLAFEKSAGKAGLDLTAVHGCEDVGVKYRRCIVRIRPWRSVVFGSVVLMCHDRHLIKVYLRDICIRCGVNMFRWYHGEDYGFGG